MIASTNASDSNVGLTYVLEVMKCKFLLTRIIEGLGLKPIDLTTNTGFQLLWATLESRQAFVSNFWVVIVKKSIYLM